MRKISIGRAAYFMSLQKKASYTTAKFFCVATFMVVAAGCSSLPSLSSMNPFASKAAPRNPPTPLAEVTQRLPVRKVWSTVVGAASIYTFSPAVSGAHIDVAAHDGSLMRLDAASGKIAWRIKASSLLTAGVGSDGATIVVAGSGGKILAFDADGKSRWTAQASSEILSAPAVGDGIVIVRSQDNRILGLDAQTGERKWALQKSSPPLTLRAAPGILIKGAHAYIALAGGKLLSVNVANGVPRWEVSVGEARGATELDRVIDTSGMPVLSGNDVCAVSYQGRAMCFNAESGTAAWAKDLSSEVGLGADERLVFASDMTGAVSALSREGGASVWKNTQLRYRGLSAPTAFGQAIAVGDAQGYVHFLSRDDGAMLSRIPTDGSAISTAPVLADSQLIVQTRAGMISALAAQ